MTGKRFKPGQMVMQSGMYMMVTPAGKAMKAPRYQHAGNHFSPTLYSGCSFRLQHAMTKDRKAKEKPVIICPKCG